MCFCKAFDFDVLETFFLERLYQFFDVNPSIVKAVMSSGERDIVKMALKIKALASITQTEDFKQSVSTFKRVANIIKNMTDSLLITDPSMHYQPSLGVQSELVSISLDGIG